MRKIAILTALLALAPWSVGRADKKEEAPPEVTVGQKLALLSKPAVVRVWAVWIAEFSIAGKFTDKAIIGGTGSGFFISPDGYVVTNAHVVEDIWAGEDKAKEKLLEALVAGLFEKVPELRGMNRQQLQQLVASIRLIGRPEKKAFIELTNGERIPYDIKAFGSAELGQGKDVAVVKIEIKNAPTLKFGDSGAVQLDDHLYAIGYPGAADLGGLGDEKSMLVASITDGKVSSIDKRTADGVPVIQVTIPIAGGNSGGPALNEKGEVVGLTTFGSSKAQGFNFLVTAKTAQEFTRQAGAQNASGVTDTTYQEGLELYWSRRYTKAIEKFEEVQQLYPAHSEIKKLLEDAREQKRLGKEVKPKKTPVALIIVGIVGGVVLLGGGVTALVLRGKKRSAPARPGAPGPAPAGYPAHGHAPPPAAAAQGGWTPPGQPAQGGSQPMRTIAIPGKATPMPGALGTLVCVRGLLAGQRFDIPANGIMVGREPSVAQIVIPDGRASTKHVWIGLDAGRVMAVDQGSTNGTYLNDAHRGRIHRAPLNEGDTVIIAEPDVATFSFSQRR